MTQPKKGSKLKCVHCCKRLARYISGLCEPCQFRSAAEGTRKTREQLILEQWRRRAAAYNKLVTEGLLQREIAALWRVSVRTLAKDVCKWKRAGIAMIPSGHSYSRAEKTPTTEVKSYKFSHGSGRWGIAGCICDLCRQRRAQGHARLAENKK